MPRRERRKDRADKAVRLQVSSFGVEDVLGDVRAWCVQHYLVGCNNIKSIGPTTCLIFYDACICLVDFDVPKCWTALFLPSLFFAPHFIMVIIISTNWKFLKRFRSIVNFILKHTQFHHKYRSQNIGQPLPTSQMIIWCVPIIKQVNWPFSQSEMITCHQIDGSIDQINSM